MPAKQDKCQKLISQHLWFESHQHDQRIQFVVITILSMYELCPMLLYQLVSTAKQVQGTVSLPLTAAFTT